MSADLLGLLALLVVAGSMGLWFRRIQRVDIPRDRRGYVAAWLLGALLGLGALVSGAGWLGGIAAGVALAGGLLATGLVAVSRQRVAGDAIRVGERLREFTALDEAGNAFAISSVVGKPLLMKFFRGHW